MAIGQSVGGDASVAFPSSQVCLGLCEVDPKVVTVSHSCDQLEGGGVSFGSLFKGLWSVMAKKTWLSDLVTGAWSLLASEQEVGGSGLGI